MLLIASLLMVGCSAETPTPDKNNNPNTEVNREPETAVPPAVVPTPEDKPQIPEEEETVKPAPEETQKPGTEEKEETVIVIPDWAKDKSYRNHKTSIHFNESGIPNLPVSGDISITEATDEKIVISVDSGTLIITGNQDSSITMNGNTLYPDVDGPEWLKGKAYQGMIVIAFDDRGILEYIDTEHKFSHISNITDYSVDIVLVDAVENLASMTIQKHDPTMETIKLTAEGQEVILVKAEKISV